MQREDEMEESDEDLINNDDQDENLNNPYEKDTVAHYTYHGANVLPFYSHCFVHKANLIIKQASNLYGRLARRIKSIIKLGKILRKRDMRKLFGAVSPDYMKHRWLSLSTIINFLIKHKLQIENQTKIDITPLIASFRLIQPILHFNTSVEGDMKSVSVVIPHAMQAIRQYDQLFKVIDNDKDKKVISYIILQIRDEIIYDKVAICAYQLSSNGLQLMYMDTFLATEIDQKDKNLKNSPILTGQMDTSYPIHQVQSQEESDDDESSSTTSEEEESEDEQNELIDSEFVDNQQLDDEDLELKDVEIKLKEIEKRIDHNQSKMEKDKQNNEKEEQSEDDLDDEIKLIKIVTPTDVINGIRYAITLERIEEEVKELITKKYIRKSAEEIQSMIDEFHKLWTKDNKSPHQSHLKDGERSFWGGW
ncbi:MAG: hypothetical protein EZS28_010886 [Streblomastix strix]|uniref:Uncharacterized protein n=1 Tax=Streblomastix strix TaxID=222440 RepID=A0A5J4WFC9_9EUKA|nr:MAG: hypothetical protein EZS28_010886 [Streblomastix strix]